MIKPLLSFFIAIAVLDNAYGQYGVQGISGSADKRTVIGWTGVRPDYVSPSTPNIWNTSPYNSIVQIHRNGRMNGTGEFISPKHVLTNVHVAEKCGTDGKPNCEIHTSDNKVIQAKAVLWGIDSLYDGHGWDKWRENEDKDWTILEITDNYCRAEYRKVGDSTQHMEGLWRAGFGSLRVLSREDIAAIRMAYIAYLRAGGSGSSYGMLIDDHDQDYVNKYKAFTDEFSRITGKDFWRDYDSDVNTLKLTQNCRFSGQDGAFQFAVLHTCDNWGGDSGSSIKRMSGDHVVGINTGGWYYITTNNDDDAVNLGIISSGFFDAKMSNLLKKAEQECKNWKPDDPEPIKPQPIKPEPDKCKLSCDNYVLDVNAGNPCSSVMPELHKQCRDATGKDMTYSMNFRYICVGYDKSPACTGQTITPITPLPGDDKCELRCDKYELNIGPGTPCYYVELSTLDKQCEQATGKKLTCQNGKCICAGYNKSPVCRGQTITPIPQPCDNKCELGCDHSTLDIRKGCPCRSDLILKKLHEQCRQATGKNMVCEDHICKCVDYSKSPICTGNWSTGIIVSPGFPTPRAGECTKNDLPAHATSGRYAICDEFSLGCEEWQRGQQYCEATACESGYGVAGGICVKEFQYKVIND